MKKSYIAIILFVVATFLWGQSADDIFDSGVTDFKGGRYGDALSSFNQLLSQYVEYRGDAYFWIAKSLIANNRIAEAEQNLEFFLANFQNNKNYPEGIYQRGRISFLKAQYEPAIVIFSDFIEQHPQSPFVANAYYWTGEALYNLGQFDQAETMFLTVINKFPTSYRLDAARYRLEIIQVSRREEELLVLLQWIQESSVSLSTELNTAELEYQEAIAYYRNRLANFSNNTIRNELSELSNSVASLEKERFDLKQQITGLENTIRRQENEIRNLQNTAGSTTVDTVSDGLIRGVPRNTKIIRSTDTDFQERLNLMTLKEESLALKDALIDRLEALLRDIEGN